MKLIKTIKFQKDMVLLLKKGKISFVDLAGSERLKESKA